MAAHSVTIFAFKWVLTTVFSLFVCVCLCVCYFCISLPSIIRSLTLTYEYTLTKVRCFHFIQKWKKKKKAFWRSESMFKRYPLCVIEVNLCFDVLWIAQCTHEIRLFFFPTRRRQVQNYKLTNKKLYFLLLFQRNIFLCVFQSEMWWIEKNQTTVSQLYVSMSKLNISREPNRKINK